MVSTRQGIRPGDAQSLTTPANTLFLFYAWMRPGTTSLDPEINLTLPPTTVVAPTHGPETDSPYWVEFLDEAETVSGAGFFVHQSYILTPLHCLPLSARAAKAEVTVRLHTSEVIVCSVLDTVDEIDLALVEVSSPGATPSRFLQTDHCLEDDGWKAPYRPDQNRPVLAGKVMDGSLEYVCEAGGRFSAIQLHSLIDIGDYRGYSGGPVEVRSPERAPRLVGMMLEQYWKSTKPKTAANVVFAATIGEALKRFAPFQLDHLQQVLFGNDGYEAGRDGNASRGVAVPPQVARLEEDMRTADRLLLYLQSRSADGLIEDNVRGPAEAMVLQRIIDRNLPT